MRHLKSDQEKLQQQRQEAANLPAPTSPSNTDYTNTTEAGLSTAERSELLRLRGQIGGLRQELAEATNQLAKMSRPAPKPATANETLVTAEQRVVRLSQSRQSIVGLLIYAQQHDNRLPQSLSDAAAFMKDVNVDELELVLEEV